MHLFFLPLSAVLFSQAAVQPISSPPELTTSAAFQALAFMVALIVTLLVLNLLEIRQLHRNARHQRNMINLFAKDDDDGNGLSDDR